MHNMLGEPYDSNEDQNCDKQVVPEYTKSKWFLDNSKIVRNAFLNGTKNDIMKLYAYSDIGLAHIWVFLELRESGVFLSQDALNAGMQIITMNGDTRSLLKNRDLWYLIDEQSLSYSMYYNPRNFIFLCENGISRDMINIVFDSNSPQDIMDVCFSNFAIAEAYIARESK